MTSRSLMQLAAFESGPASEQALQSIEHRRAFRPVTAFATTALLAAAACLNLAISPALAKEEKASHSPSTGASSKTGAKCKEQWVSSNILIKAPPSEVWRSIHEERAKDPDLSYSKVLEQISPTEYKLEQKFNFIPVIGSSVCVMSHKEIVNERIDYALLHSDRFKAMEGSWVLTPYDQGRKTKLELSSHLDLGLPVPRMFMNSVTTKKIQKRLSNVKAMAETNASIAAAKEVHPADSSMVAAKDGHRSE